MCSEPFNIQMILRCLHNLKPHPHSNRPLISWHTQHPKTRLPLNTPINPAITYQRVPRLLLVLLRRIWIHIRYLTPRTSCLDIDLQPLVATPSSPVIPVFSPTPFNIRTVFHESSLQAFGALSFSRLESVVAPRMITFGLNLSIGISECSPSTGCSVPQYLPHSQSVKAKYQGNSCFLPYPTHPVLRCPSIFSVWGLYTLASPAF